MALTKEDKNYIEERLRQQKEEFLEVVQNMFVQFKSDMYEFFDPILKEIKNSGEERDLISHRLSDHEDRITSLETKSV
jgi:hypothetical protein